MSDFDRYSSVSEMLSTLESLKNKRDNQFLLILFKLISGLVDVHIPECMVNNFLIMRGHNRHFVNISASVDSYKFTFFPRTIPMWNALSSEALDKCINIRTVFSHASLMINITLIILT